MSEVMTVRGAIDASVLGTTLAHEHLFLHSAGLPAQYPWLYDRASALAHVVRELEQARAVGVGTLVDVTTPDLGRDISLIREASERAGVHVVAATGIWVDVPRWFSRASVDEICGVFVHEIEHGIAGSESRAGVIKVANDASPGVGEVQERILRAAARAAATTRVPVTTHTSPYGIGREQMKVFASEDVEPALIAIGHAFTDDLEYLHEVLDAGHYLSIDTFAYSRGTALEPNVLDAIATLTREGFAGRLMLSHDHTPEWDWRPHGPHEEPSIFTYISRDIVPALRDRGLADGDLDAMLVQAPAAFLSGRGG